MKKISLLVMAVALTALVSCVDTGNAPEITIYGDAIVDIVVGDVNGFTDDGFIAEDNEDGDVTANVVTGGDVPDVNIVGEYTIEYTVTDADGNTGTAQRIVNVYNEAAVMEGTYDIVEIGGPVSPWTFVDVITTSSTVNNKIWVERMADFTNGIVSMNITGSSVMIPVQTVNCGSTGFEADRQFSGQGTVNTDNGVVMVINLTELTNGTTITTTDTYTMQ